jgi:GntR family transcriptional regulator
MSAKVNPNSIVPMYKQVLNILTEQIKNGELKHGDKLPSEAELMKQYGVSRITIRGAIAELVEEGILERSQGKGTFVATPKELYTAKDDFGFTRSCILSGKKPSTKLLSKEMIYPSQNDMEYFQIRETDKILCTKRLRFVDGEPTMVETNHYAPTLEFLFNESLEGSLFELLGNKYNIYVNESIRTVEVCIATKEEAALLKVKSNTPLLLFKDRQKDSEGRPLFMSRQVYCTERLKFYL